MKDILDSFLTVISLKDYIKKQIFRNKWILEKEYKNVYQYLEKNHALHIHIILSLSCLVSYFFLICFCFIHSLETHYPYINVKQDS